MKRVIIVFLLIAYVLSGIIECSDDLIRLPLIPRASRAADGLTKLNAESFRDKDYGVPVGIGIPPQNFVVIFDSGSAELWVSSKSTGLKDKNLFDESASSTFQSEGKEFFFGYESGYVNGTVAVETVSVGDLKITNQPFGLANKGSSSGVPFDGVMGFSYPSVAQTDNSSMIDRLYEQGQVKKRVVCVKLRLKKESKSEVIFGGCDVEADNWVPVIKINGQYTGWRVKLTKVILRSTQDNSELLTFEPDHESVFDTGANDIIGMPDKYADMISQKLDASYNGQHYIVDCNNRTGLPNIEFYFGEAKVTMAYDDYTWNYRGECQVGMGNGGTTFLFGSTFFNQATIIFDRDNNRIGVTPK